MASIEDARYRLRLAEGFLGEARQDAELSRWRSCVDNSQLATENAAKAVLALLGPVRHSHGAGKLLHEAHASNAFSGEISPQVLRLTGLSEQLGWDVHIASDHGDEAQHHTPWEMFDEAAAQRAFAIADDALTLAQEIVAAGL